MALDFYKTGTKEHLYSIEENEFDLLEPILTQYQYRTGLTIDNYGSGSRARLSLENMGILIAVIDSCVTETNLNANKREATAILEFKGVLKYFVRQGWEFDLAGD